MKKTKRRRSEPSTAAAAVAAPLGLRILFVSLCVSIGFETLFFWTAVGNAFTVPKVVAVLFGSAILLPQVCLRLFNEPFSNSRRLLLALAGFQLLVLTWATAHSFSPAVSFWGGDWRRMGWITQFAMISAAIAVPLAIGSDFVRWKRLLQFITAVGAVSAGYGILQWIGWDPFLPNSMRDGIIAEFAGVYRSSGTIGQPAYFANYLVYPFFAALALLALETGPKRWLAGGAITIIAIGLVTTGSRNGMLGCASGVGAFFIWMILRQWKPSIRLAVPVVVVLLAVLLLVAGLSSFRHRAADAVGRLPGGTFLTSRLASTGTDSASIGRLILWRDVVRRILPEVWRSGTGPGMFRVAFTRYRSDSYARFGPDVHWENAHNLFLDRFTEQGILGLLAILTWIAALGYNINIAIRASPDRKRAAAYTAIGAGLVGILVSYSFNGELIPTTYYFYLWIAISFAARDCAEQPVPGYPLRLKQPNPLPARFFLGAAIAISIGLAWYAERNWYAERMLRAGETAINSGNWPIMLIAREEAERAMPHVGTYHLEFVQLVVAFLGKPHAGLDGPSRRRLAEIGIADARTALERTDKPMIALQDMIVLADLTGDARFEDWTQDLLKLDPYWFRPHEVSARILMRQGKIDEALREATIAHELAPYVESSASLWEQLLELQRVRNANRQ